MEPGLFLPHSLQRGGGIHRLPVKNGAARTALVAPVQEPKETDFKHPGWGLVRRIPPARLPRACAEDVFAGYGQARWRRAAAARSGLLRVPGPQAPNARGTSA